MPEIKHNFALTSEGDAAVLAVFDTLTSPVDDLGELCRYQDLKLRQHLLDLIYQRALDDYNEVKLGGLRKGRFLDWVGTKVGLISAPKPLYVNDLDDGAVQKRLLKSLGWKALFSRNDSSIAKLYRMATKVVADFNRIEVAENQSQLESNAKSLFYQSSSAFSDSTTELTGELAGKSMSIFQQFWDSAKAVVATISGRKSKQASAVAQISEKAVHLNLTSEVLTDYALEVLESQQPGLLSKQVRAEMPQQCDNALSFDDANCCTNRMMYQQFIKPGLEAIFKTYFVIGDSEDVFTVAKSRSSEDDAVATAIASVESLENDETAFSADIFSATMTDLTAFFNDFSSNPADESSDLLSSRDSFSSYGSLKENLPEIKALQAVGQLQTQVFGCQSTISRMLPTPEQHKATFDRSTTARYDNTVNRYLSLEVDATLRPSTDLLNQKTPAQIHLLVYGALKKVTHSNVKLKDQLGLSFGQKHIASTNTDFQDFILALDQSCDDNQVSASERYTLLLLGGLSYLVDSAPLRDWLASLIHEGSTLTFDRRMQSLSIAAAKQAWGISVEEVVQLMTYFPEQVQITASDDIASSVRQLQYVDDSVLEYEQDRLSGENVYDGRETRASTVESAVRNSLFHSSFAKTVKSAARTVTSAARTTTVDNVFGHELSEDPVEALTSVEPGVIAVMGRFSQDYMPVFYDRYISFCLEGLAPRVSMAMAMVMTYNDYFQGSSATKDDAEFRQSIGGDLNKFCDRFCAWHYKKAGISLVTNRKVNTLLATKSAEQIESLLFEAFNKVDVTNQAHNPSVASLCRLMHFMSTEIRAMGIMRLFSAWERVVRFAQKNLGIATIGSTILPVVKDRFKDETVKRKLDKYRLSQEALELLFMLIFYCAKYSPASANAAVVQGAIETLFHQLHREESDKFLLSTIDELFAALDRLQQQLDSQPEAHLDALIQQSHTLLGKINGSLPRKTLQVAFADKLTDYISSYSQKQHQENQSLFSQQAAFDSSLYSKVESIAKNIVPAKTMSKGNLGLAGGRSWQSEGLKAYQHVFQEEHTSLESMQIDQPLKETYVLFRFLQHYLKNTKRTDASCAAMDCANVFNDLCEMITLFSENKETNQAGVKERFAFLLLQFMDVYQGLKQYDKIGSVNRLVNQINASIASKLEAGLPTDVYKAFFVRKERKKVYDRDNGIKAFPQSVTQSFDSKENNPNVNAAGMWTPPRVPKKGERNEPSPDSVVDGVSPSKGGVFSFNPGAVANKLFAQKQSGMN